MGRHYQRISKSIKAILVCLCAVLMLGVICVNEVAAKVAYYNEVGYGWKKEDNRWYYIKEDGDNLVNWLLDADGNWYFMNEDGVMQTGWIEWKGQKYFLASGGAMQTGWMNLNGDTYYFRPGNGDMLVGSNVIDGHSYNFDTDGKLIGEVKTEAKDTAIEETTVTEDANTGNNGGTVAVVTEPTFAGPYYDRNGYGWKKVGSVWNYIQTNGSKAVNWVLDTDGRWYFMGQDGAMLTNSWLDWKGQKYFLTDDGAMQVGWMTTEAGTYYFCPGNGDMLVGTNVIDGQTYNFGADGKLVSGWQIIDGATYFYDSATGKPVTGVVLIDGVQYGFNDEGKLDNSVIPWNLVLVNYNNSIPEDFKISKKKVSGYYVDARMAEALKTMIKAAKADGVTLKITSGYRTIATQERLYNNALKKYLNLGLAYEDALVQTNLYHAEPGKSEHNLGLAIDFIYGSSLNESFAYSDAGIWLKEHAHEYGFILRYTEEKIDITRIAYEPWHYRYVGVQEATAMKELGVCLEEIYPSYTTVPTVGGNVVAQ